MGEDDLILKKEGAEPEEEVEMELVAFSPVELIYAATNAMELIDGFDPMGDKKLEKLKREIRDMAIRITHSCLTDLYNFTFDKDD